MSKIDQLRMSKIDQLRFFRALQMQEDAKVMTLNKFLSKWGEQYSDLWEDVNE